MLTLLSANLINIALIAVIVLIVALLLCGMIRDRKAEACACGGSCGGCSKCGAAKSANGVPGRNVR